MAKVELKQLVGHRRRNGRGPVIKVTRKAQQLFYNGRQVAVISSRPGAPISLLHGIELSENALKEISDAVAVARGGVPPARIAYQTKLPGELLDDEDNE
jgi:formate dehydrogenase assembly factor FdhD